MIVDVNMETRIMSSTVNLRSPRTLSGLLVGLVALGLVLLIAMVPDSPIRDSTLQLVVLLALPVLVAVVAYMRTNPTAPWWELVGLSVWGAVAVSVTAFIGFFATVDTPGGYPGATQEFIEHAVHFLAAVVGLGVPYAVAGALRNERPYVALIGIFLVPVFLLVLFVGSSALL